MFAAIEAMRYPERMAAGLSTQPKTVAAAVRARRLAFKFTQKRLALLAGTTTGTICHIERGIRLPSLGVLARIAKALECSTDSLLAGQVKLRQNDQYLRQVAAVMKALPKPAQKEVVAFCEYQLQRQRSAGKKP